MSDLDWVTARHQCSLDSIFNQLATQVQADVETRKALSSGTPLRCDVENHVISVILEGIPGMADSVHFCKTESGIEVWDKNRKHMFVGTPTLNDEGECRLKVKGEEKELWQFRKMALEDLFFTPLKGRLARITGS